MKDKRFKSYFYTSLKQLKTATGNPTEDENTWLKNQANNLEPNLQIINHISMQHSCTFE
jgi:hypothetical protein